MTPTVYWNFHSSVFRRHRRRLEAARAVSDVGGAPTARFRRSASGEGSVHFDFGVKNDINDNVADNVADSVADNVADEGNADDNNDNDAASGDAIEVTPLADGLVVIRGPDAALDAVEDIFDSLLSFNRSSGERRAAFHAEIGKEIATGAHLAWKPVN